MRVLLDNVAFRRLFLGRLLANAGDSLYYVAAMWLVYELGGSAFYTGLAGFLARFPLTLQFLVGPLVDRSPLKRPLVASPLAQALLLLSVPLAAVTGVLNVWVVLAVMPLVAAAAQFAPPAQHATMPRIVEKEDLVEANSAFSFAYQGTDLVFIALGGVLVGLVGAVTMFVVDSIALAIAAGLFALVAIPDARNAERSGSDEPILGTYLAELRAGLSYVRGSVLMAMLVGTMVLNFVTGATMAVLPAFAARHGGPETYGLLLAAILGGVLVGALSTSLFEHFRLGPAVSAGFALSGVAWLCALVVPGLAATAALFGLTWIAGGAYNVLSTSLKQTYVPEELLGRVSSVSVSLSVAALPIGSLLGGIAGEHVGVVAVMAATGVGLLFVAGYWLAHPALRGMPAVGSIEPERYGLTEPDVWSATDRSG